jgi:hypothetical protein
MPKQRNRYLFPTRRGFLGENNTDAETEDAFASGYLARLRNYHLDGKGAIRKRQGWEEYNSNAINGSTNVQGLGVWDFSGAPKLVGIAGDKVKTFSESGSDWTDITGSLTINAGQDYLWRFCQFHDGTVGNLIGTDNVGSLFKWTGTGNATALTTLTKASDVQQFKSHVFAINTNHSAGNRSTAIRYSDTGDPTSWPNDNVFDCTRDSDGVGFSLHSNETLLAFYEHSIYRINFDYGGAGALTSFFTNQLVDGTVGCASRTSIVSSKGRTYFANSQGIYMVGDVQQPAVYISRPLEDLWATINKTRIKYIYAFERGEPWNEIVFLVSTGNNTKHNTVLVYNTEVAQKSGVENAWSVFTASSSKLEFNVGVNYPHTTSANEYTILGKYSDSKIAKAWGTDNLQVSYTDGGTNVATTAETGYLDFGYEGVKSIREVWMDMTLTSQHDFSINVNSPEGTLSTSTQLDLGGSFGTLDVDFTLNTSTLATGDISQARFKLTGNSRYFKVRLEEADSTKPQRIESFHFLFVPKGMRIK